MFLSLKIFLLYVQSATYSGTGEVQGSYLITRLHLIVSDNIEKHSTRVKHKTSPSSYVHLGWASAELMQGGNHLPGLQ